MRDRKKKVRKNVEKKKDLEIKRDGIRRRVNRACMRKGVKMKEKKKPR